MSKDWKEEYRSKLKTAEEAVKLVHDGDCVYMGTVSSYADVLCEALYKRESELSNVTISSGTTLKMPSVYTKGNTDIFKFRTYFAGPAERAAMHRAPIQYTSLYLSQVDRWVEESSGITVAFIDVSEPDENGYMSFGAYGTSMHGEICKFADRVVLQVNKQAPYVNGEGTRIHISEADCVVEVDSKLAEVPDLPFDDVVEAIADQVVEHICDGATIQLGLGNLSGAIGYKLEHKKDLGVHSEMFTNSMMHLMKNGNITNKAKTFMPGKAVAAFALGSRELYDFVDRNVDIHFASYTFVNDPYMIAKNDNFISINNTMAVDLFGQAASDNLGGKQQSAVGGQVDFMRGALLSKGGKSFLCMPSVRKTKDGNLCSKIMSSLPPATAITASRSDVQYVVTEYGCVNLKPLAQDERAKALISIAHPDFREQLTDEAKKYGIIF